MMSYNRCPQKIKLKILDLFTKYFIRFSGNFEKFFEKCIDFMQNNSKKWRNSFKMYIFSIEWLIENILLLIKNRTKEIKKR